MDVHNKKTRSYNMSRIKSRNTKPEIVVRSLLFKRGYRYRLHDKAIPGKPDIIFRNRKKVIFVHGCFWHRHKDCPYSTTPKTNMNFWNDKFNKNMIRDKKVQREIKKLGWSSLIIWECTIKDQNKLLKKLNTFLN